MQGRFLSRLGLQPQLLSRSRVKITFISMTSSRNQFSVMSQKVLNVSFSLDTTQKQPHPCLWDVNCDGMYGGEHGVVKPFREVVTSARHLLDG